MNRNDLFSAMEFIDEEIIENSEVKRTVNNKKRISKTTIMLVAVLCLLTAFATAAIAVKLFGLRDTLVDTNDPEIISEMTLSGYTGSNEYMAAAEWNAFTESYDPDGSILARVSEEGFDDPEIDELFMYYSVYTQEMADKLHEITAKHGLSLHSGFKEVYLEDWNTAVGEFIVNDYEEFSDKAYNTILAGYMYDDGTFRYDGIFDAPAGRLTVDYQFSCSAKGVFDPIFLNIGDIADYKEQTIVTDSGVELAAALSEYKSVLVTELDSCFVCINVMGGAAAGITFDDLEALANTFDFSVIESVKGKSAQDAQDTADTEPAQDINEIADGELDWEQGYIEVSREGIVEKIPVDILRVLKSDATIAMAPEYFTYSVCESVDTFSYDAWEGGSSVYYSVYANNAHTAEQFADLLQQYYADSYRSVMIENTRVGDYDAVAVYCEGNNIAPDYNKYYFLIPTDDGCAVIETQFTIEMYEGLYQIMRTLFDTFKMG